MGLEYSGLLWSVIGLFDSWSGLRLLCVTRLLGGMLSPEPLCV
jgi:hypothetical protein